MELVFFQEDKQHIGLKATGDKKKKRVQFVINAMKKLNEKSATG